MRVNTVKAKLRRGEPSYGIWLDDPTPNRIEFYGHLGFEFVIIDTEHRPINPEICRELIRASDVVGVVPIVRPRDHRASTILPFLEAGAMGVYMPHVDTAEQAKAIVDAVKYTPQGRRGAGSATRAANYGLTQPAKEYFRQANEETLVILLVEDVVGVANLDEIVQVEGVDMVCLGPGDLSHSMGKPGERDESDVMRVVRESEAKIAASGLAYDCEPKSAADARDAIQRGALLIPFFERQIVTALFGGVLRDVREDALLSQGRR